MHTKFYIDTDANDDNAYKTAMNYACELAKNDFEIKKIVLYIHTKKDTSWFDRLFNTEIVKKLFNGYKYNNCATPFKFETKLTYKNYMNNNEKDIVICCGMDSEDIIKIDNYHCVKYVIAIPGLTELIQKWIKISNAIEIK